MIVIEQTTFQDHGDKANGLGTQSCEKPEFFSDA
jgi:hypothetical protein